MEVRGYLYPALETRDFAHTLVTRFLVEDVNDISPDDYRVAIKQAMKQVFPGGPDDLASGVRSSGYWTNVRKKHSLQELKFYGDRVIETGIDNTYFMNITMAVRTQESSLPSLTS